MKEKTTKLIVCMGVAILLIISIFYLNYSIKCECEEKEDWGPGRRRWRTRWVRWRPRRVWWWA